MYYVGILSLPQLIFLTKKNSRSSTPFIEVVSEITVAVGGVQIEAPEIDYLSFQTSDSTINIDQVDSNSN